MQANEYEPWKERGETELAYYKRLFLEQTRRAGYYADALCAVRGSARGVIARLNEIIETITRALRKP